MSGGVPPAASPNGANQGGNGLTWLLLALVVAAIGLVGWWAFFAVGVGRAPEVRVISGSRGAPPAAQQHEIGGANLAPAPPSPSSRSAPALGETVAPESATPR